MNKLKIINLKFVNFIIQILILSFIIYIFRYKVQIDFDKSISSQRQAIIQFLAKYVIFDSNNLSGMVFIYIIWLIAAFVPILNFNDYKKAYSMNLYTFFFPNFFFYVFLYRYSPNFFNSNFLSLITRTIILGLVLIFFTILISLILKKIRKSEVLIPISNLKIIENKNKGKCPQCGTEFNSIPVYCYNCLKKLEYDNDISKKKSNA